MQTVQMVLMKLTVVATMVALLVQMVNLTVTVMALNVFMIHGHVMDGLTVQTVLMKLIVQNFLVKTKVNGIVAMANVFLHHMYVMDQLIPVMQVGVQTVQMVQMKA